MLGKDFSMWLLWGHFKFLPVSLYHALYVRPINTLGQKDLSWNHTCLWDLMRAGEVLCLPGEGILETYILVLIVDISNQLRWDE